MSSEPSGRSAARGLFIVLEGGEGGGKSTQAALLADRLSESGFGPRRAGVVRTREPGGSPIAEQIRSLILSESSVNMSGRCEALLFAAARAEHVSAVIAPALESGDHVVCDRFVDSSIAYQGAARGLGAGEVANISAWATDGLMPDLTILLDIDPTVGLGRAQDRNRLEDEALAFHEAVRRTLRDLADSDPEGHVVISATGTIEDVAARIWAVVESRLAFRHRSDESTAR